MATVNLLAGSRNLPDQLTIADQPAHRGGEGSIYFTSDGRYVVKLYHSAPPDKRAMLQKIIDLGKNLGDDEQFLAWPLGIVERVNGKPSIGVVTRRAPATHQPLYKFMLGPEDAVEQFRQGRSWLEYLKMARGIAASVRAVHGKGMAHGDVHLKNFLANPASGEVILIDLDGLIVKGFLHPQVMGMPGFIAPEVMMHKSQPDELTDRYSLAVLILWTLLLRNVMLTQRCYDDQNQRHDDELGYGQYACFSEHPADRRNWISRIGMPLFRGGLLSYRALTPRLQTLTEQTLIQGLHEPQQRPQALEWERALAEAYDMLISCSVCRQSFFYQYWLQPPPRRTCPFCGASTRALVSAELLEARASGTFVTVRTIVLYHGLPLFSDIMEPGRVPPFSRRGTPIVARTTWDAGARAYSLQNMDATPWTIVAGGSGKVPQGASVLLRRGLILSPGNGKRLLRIME
jgi:DNA-binding helix-hairpin-helix protein with protein kinase domain